MTGNEKRGRPRKSESEKREKVTFTTLPKIIEFMDKKAFIVFMTRSEFIHRILADVYNEEHLDDQIEYWNPKKYWNPTDEKCGRPRKSESEKREKVTFTTLPKIIEFMDKKRGFMTRSEFIHRKLADDYNKENPDVQIEYWKPKRRLDV